MLRGRCCSLRFTALVAATAIAVACGTNYAYSAWAPQLAERMKLSSSVTNLIGTFGNLGMYASGIPIGMFVDRKGPRPAATIGAIALFAGYYPIYRAYIGGPGSMSVPLLCLFSAFTGVGSASAFASAVKVSALNWPEHRGTATAFPLSGFGLSAFFFSTLSSVAFPNNTADFLLVLATGTFALIFVSMFFLQAVPPTQQHYSTIPTSEESPSNSLTRTKSGESRRTVPGNENETGTAQRNSFPREGDQEADWKHVPPTPEMGSEEADERSSLMSRSTVSGPGDGPDSRHRIDHSRYILDIRGTALLRTLPFWQILFLFGLLTGVGLMTINNVGNDVHALWGFYEPSVTEEFLQKQQVFHVSLLSILSFSGRLLSGVGSDLITKRLGGSRFLCLLASSCVFCVAQICAMTIEDPHMLWAVSGLTGLAYGFLFGVFPALVADSFGVGGFSQNWGCMCLAPVVSGNVFNLLYGSIYDQHSELMENGETGCLQGVQCYRSAYSLTLAAGLAGIVLSLWSIRTERRRKQDLERTSWSDQEERIE